MWLSHLVIPFPAMKEGFYLCRKAHICRLLQYRLCWSCRPWWVLWFWPVRCQMPISCDCIKMLLTLLKLVKRLRILKLCGSVKNSISQIVLHSGKWFKLFKYLKKKTFKTCSLKGYGIDVKICNVNMSVSLNWNVVSYLSLSEVSRVIFHMHWNHVFTFSSLWSWWLWWIPFFHLCFGEILMNKLPYS